jgi:nucleoside phosphorylase
LLTKDNTWINHDDLIADFEELPHAISDGALRGSINNYFLRALPDRSDKKNKEPTKKDRAQAAKQTIEHYPEIIDYYIKYKEDQGDKAVAVSNARVDYAESLFLKNFTQLAFLLAEESDFYEFAGDTLHSAIGKALCLKEVVENKGGSSYFYDEQCQLVSREDDIRIAHRFTWLNRPFENLPDKSSSARRATELPSDLLKRLTPVDFKMANNTNLRKYFLKRNEHQQKEVAPKTVVVLFHQREIEKVNVQLLLTELAIPLSPDVVFINLQQREHNRILVVTEQSMCNESRSDVNSLKPQGSTYLNPRAIFFTALRVEFGAVRSFLSNVHEVQGMNGSIYEQGVYNCAERQWDVFLVETGAGNVDTAIEAERAINQTNPYVVFFVGVAGGVKDVKLGDVVAATKIYAYESGADKESFQPRPVVGESAYMLTERAKAEARNPNWLRLLGKDNSKPNVLVGPIAAGEKVVKSKSSDTYRLIRTHYSDVLAVEMEGHGLLRAARASSVNAIVIRGISDLLDNKEQVDAEGSQERAAFHASAFAFQMLSRLKPIVEI